VEMTIGIMVGCMPTTAAVFRRWRSSISSVPTSTRRRLRFGPASSLKAHAKLDNDSNIRPLQAHSRYPINTTGAETSVQEEEDFTSNHPTLAPLPCIYSPLSVQSRRNTLIRKSTDSTSFNVWSTSHLESHSSTQTQPGV